MMGFALKDLETPVTKGTSGILVLTKKEVRESETTRCIGCGRCVAVCPMGLQPTLLYKYINSQKIDEAVSEGLMDCVECGSCAFTCPARILLVQGFRLGKALKRKQGAVKK